MSIEQILNTSVRLFKLYNYNKDNEFFMRYYNNYFYNLYSQGYSFSINETSYELSIIRNKQTLLGFKIK